MCGKGKTSYAIQMMNENPDRSFIYVTPLLSEVERIKQSTTATFYEPTYRNNGRKLDDFNNLLCNGYNIATTHSTFTNSTDETIELLRAGSYTLVLDEVIDVVTPLNDVIADKTERIKPKDVKMLLDKKLITTDQYGRVSWIADSYEGGHFTDVERMAKKGNLLLINNTLFLWEFPAEMFNVLDEVIVCTYLFNGSFLKYFFQYHGLNYSLVGVVDDGDKYNLAEYKPDTMEQTKYKPLINIYNDSKLNDYPNTALSSTWCKNSLDKKKKREKHEYKPATQKLKNDLYNFFNNKMSAAASDIAWTIYKDYKAVIEGKGYTRVRNLTADEMKLPQREREQLQNKLSCFIPANARASNDYRERSILAYCCNMGIHPHIRQFFKLKEIEIDDDAFALSCLIQWIFRSRIRDGKPISIYLPSPKIRKLFNRWLDGEAF